MQVASPMLSGDSLMELKKPVKQKSNRGTRLLQSAFRTREEMVWFRTRKRYEQRLIHSKPKPEAFLAWLKETSELTAPKSH